MDDILLLVQVLKCFEHVQCEGTSLAFVKYFLSDHLVHIKSRNVLHYDDDIEGALVEVLDARKTRVVYLLQQGGLLDERLGLRPVKQAFVEHFGDVKSPGYSMFDEINIEAVAGSDPPGDLKVEMEIREDDELVDGIKKGLSINFKG